MSDLIIIEREILKKLEWIQDEFTGATGGQCRICGGFKYNIGLRSNDYHGHKPNCELDIALSRKYDEIEIIKLGTKKQAVPKAVIIYK